MSNTWFQFRQFRIEQDRCAMKITTDACIQGAWTPLPEVMCRVLDIGTGTGLLSLMLAQRSEALRIDAIEYDAPAAGQALHNAKTSPWIERIKVINTDVRDYAATAKYDLIICNPPFFSNSLLSDKHPKNMARHDVSLTMNELLQAVTRNLAEDGYLSLLLPYTEYQLWKEPASAFGLREARCLQIKHKPGAPVKRVVTIMTVNAKETTGPETLTIKDDNGDYSAEFKNLLSDFYLNL